MLGVKHIIDDQPMIARAQSSMLKTGCWMEGRETLVEGPKQIKELPYGRWSLSAYIIESYIVKNGGCTLIFFELRDTGRPIASGYCVGHWHQQPPLHARPTPLHRTFAPKRSSLRWNPPKLSF